MGEILMTMLGVPALVFVIMILFWVAVFTALGILKATLAGEKGYNKFGFFWYGFFFFPIAVGVVILAPPLNNNQQRIEEEDDEMAEYEKMYEAGTLSYTELCRKKEELERRKFYK